MCHNDDDRSSSSDDYWALLTWIIGLQAGLMIGKAVNGIAGAVPIGIAKFGL
jgi:hypothetical protein